MSSATERSQHMAGSPSGNEARVGRDGWGTEHYIEDYPASTALVTFLSGLGAGYLLATMLIAEQKKRSRQNIAERLGYQMLDYLHDVVPKSLSDRLHR